MFKELGPQQSSQAQQEGAEAEDDDHQVQDHDELGVGGGAREKEGDIAIIYHI